MNAVEIEEAVSELASSPFDPAEFPFAFLTAFGNKATTVNRLRTPSLNKSDVAGGVLQARNIHLAVSAEGRVRETMAALRASTKTAANKVKFLLATDGVTLEAEDLVSDEPPIICNYPDFAEHFGFFLPLAGISTVRAIKNNPIDIKATGRLNKLYVELLKDNPEWATEARRHEMNQFMARLIFCFFAEDTGIFLNHLFTKTIEQMSDSQSGNTHEVLQELFRAMATPTQHEGKLDGRYRKAAGIKNWADAFPFVNGGLFPEAGECPRFSRIARSYLLRAAELNWQEINPDIFGSMIQAVADDEERGELGMHYTSVPNILKVLNPLFLDDLREQLEAAGDNLRKLRNLRKRLSAIRVFDPACGSGNFLVIAYREMRQIEHEIVTRTRDNPKSVIPLANFYGIEIKGFAAEIARLALLIAEFQCDVRLISQKEARLNVLPLHKTGQIHIGNALRLDWREVCPLAENVAAVERDLSGLEAQLSQDNGQAGIHKIETYICGNPQFKGARKQNQSQKDDMALVFNGHNDYKDCDYVCGWYIKASQFTDFCPSEFAFVSTSSICEGEQVAHLWSRMYGAGCHISFAHQGFRWRNNASNNAVVQCVIIGVSRDTTRQKQIYESNTKRQVDSISPYLTAGEEVYVTARDEPLSNSLNPMVSGSMPRDDGNLILSREEARSLLTLRPSSGALLRGLVGSQELVHFRNRLCLWINEQSLDLAAGIPEVAERINRVRIFRQNSSAKTTQGYASIPHMFAQRAHRETVSLCIAKTTSENRPYFPADFLRSTDVISDAAFAVYEPSLWEFSIVVSKLHLTWIATVCGRLESRYRYSSTLGWNTFPIPRLTERNKADLTRCAEDILIAREAHFPQTLAELYNVEDGVSQMPDDLRAAHERNDETLERIYVGREFRNDTERLEKLFDLYTKMTADRAPKKPAKRGAA